MVDLFIVLGYLLVTIVLGLRIASRVTTTEEYQTAGRHYSSWVVFATLSASFIGGGFTIGLAEKTFTYGMVFWVAMLGFSVKEILIAKWIAPKMNRFRHAVTVGDVMQTAFGQRAKIFTGFASVIVCGGIIGAQISACGNILYTFLGIPNHYGSLLIAITVLLYAAYGGLKSVVAVDIVHFSLLVIMLPLVFVFGILHIDGWDSLLSHLPATHTQLTGGIGWGTLLILFLSFFLGETLIPPYLQRLLIGKSAIETEQGTLWSGILSIPFFAIIGGIGLVASVLEPALTPHLAMPYVIKVCLPIGLKGLAIAALLAVVMSSADSFLNSTAIAMTNDVLMPLGLQPKTSKQGLLMSRLVTIVIGSVAIAFALSSSSALDILLYSYQFWTPFILVPLVAAIFQVRSSDRVFFISAGLGILALFTWNHYFPQARIEGALEGVIVGVACNSLAFFLVQKILHPRSEHLALES